MGKEADAVTAKGAAAQRAGFQRGDILGAAGLVLAMTALGLVIFVISVAVVSVWGRGMVDPAALEPGLGLSAQALGLAFALAGALASTVVAYSALKAQNSAVQAQLSAETARDDAARREGLERRVTQLRDDIQRHAALTDAMRTVFATAETVVEFVGEDIRRLLSVPLDHKGELPAFDVTRCAAPLIASHQQFWDALRRACETGTREVSLDVLWQERGKGDPLHMERLSAAVGMFGLGAEGSRRLRPSTLSSLGTPMTPVVAGDVMTIVWGVACDQAAEEMADAAGKITKEVTRGHARVLERVDRDLGDARSVIARVIESQGSVFALGAQADAVMQEIVALSGSVDGDLVAGTRATSLAARLDAAGVALDRLVQDAADLRRHLPDPGHAAHVLDKVEQQLDGVLDEVRVSVLTMTNRLRESNAELGARVAEALMLSRHSPKPGRRDPLAALAALVAGAIVFPDGALLRIRDGEGWEWKLNPGLALIEDLTVVYLDRCGSGEDGATAGMLDLARLLPDSAQLETPFGAEAYGTLKAKQVGQVPVALDAFWRNLRDRRAVLLDAMMHRVHAGPYRPSTGSEEDHALIEGLLSGERLADVELLVEPVPEPAETAETAHAEANGLIERPPF